MVGEYYVAEVPMTLAAVMHFRVSPLTQGQGLDSGNHNTSITNALSDTIGVGAAGGGAGGGGGGVAAGIITDKDRSGVVVASLLDLAGYDVLDLPLGSSPEAMLYLHSSPLSLVCMTTTTVAVGNKGSSNKDGPSSNNLASIRVLGDVSSLSLENGGVRFHDRFSRHVEELLGDRYLRAMKGQPPEGDGPEEVDDDE